MAKRVRCPRCGGTNTKHRRHWDGTEDVRCRDCRDMVFEFREGYGWVRT
jgi:hypothetical protein